MKQETLEEAAENYNDDFQIKGGSKPPHIKNVHIMNHFIAGAKWQQKRSYSEEEVLDILDHHTSYLETFIYQYIDRQDIEVNEEWFKQFKKK